jgi:hypothetical protein
MQRLKFVSLLFAIFLISNTISISGQEKKEEKKTGKDRFVFGGNVGLQFGTITSFDISPIAGYYITNRLLWTLSPTYQYYREKYLGKGFSASIFGGRTGAIYYIVNIGQNLRIKSDFSLFGQAEYEALNLDRDFSDYTHLSKVSRYWLNGILVGGGVRQGLGKSSSFSISILYNFLANNKTPYDNPVLRIGFFF